VYIRAIGTKKRAVIYFDVEGNRMIRRDGTWAWRNNNPGNIIKGRKARSLGSIGAAGGFAVFPDYEAGRNALHQVPTTSYPTTTLFTLIKHYAPPKENDVKRYPKMLADFAGLSLKRIVNSLSAPELERLKDAIQRIEGWDSGREEILGPAKEIIDVKRNKARKIVGYLVEDLGMLSPAATVNGILSGEIDVVVADRGGKTYVRTRPDPVLENNLESKGLYKTQRRKPR
jgi:hypothetical protein